MSYGNDLVTILRPLGVYSFREGSFSLAELQALGAALDEADTTFSEAQKETIVLSAGDEGLSKWEALFRSRPPAKTIEARRAAIAGFLRISGDSFTLAALNRCLCACGVACSVEETGEVNHVKVWFPGVMGIPDGFSQMKIIIEDILPGFAGSKTPYKVVVDRVEAIHWAMDHAEKDDVIVLCGKGHETYQEVNHVKHHMDEREIVADYLKAGH